MSILDRVLPWDDDTYGNNVRTLRVLIECEKGSVHKYEWDDKLGVMVIVRDLHENFPYLHNYGCVPSTLEDDGDNLDAIVLSEEPIRSGTMVNCYPLGIVRMVDNGQRDDKLVCVPFYLTEGTVDLKKIVRYLSTYKYPYQDGTQIVGFEGKEAAEEAINRAYLAYLSVRG